MGPGLIIIVKKLEEMEIIVIAGNFKDHVGNNPENYEDQRGGYGYAVRNKERKKFLNFERLWNGVR